MFPRGGVFTFRVLAQHNGDVGGRPVSGLGWPCFLAAVYSPLGLSLNKTTVSGWSSCLGFRLGMFPRGGVFTFRVLA